ncbi:HNH endonuclease [Bradyrhizobium sp.]|jgi:5-methylcytosine-specific restriction protein A|uniref:HNH endonuclease n=1 Tax=Bradyrhizobium sp. TaxID=376 RepID=UPI002DDD8F2D|nr:HNH endonuclease [Bradyrhizobium sp.]HEV2155810.1 HNH endonuclease [Bradyrhizobium sp.]
MPLEAGALARLISDSCGLPFDGRRLTGANTFQIHPSGLPVQNTFTIQTAVGWRNVEVSFVPGSFAGDFVRHMGLADAGARTSCAAVLARCLRDGASVNLKINGRPARPDDPSGWDGEWSRLELSVRRGQLDLGNGDQDNEKIFAWTQQVTAAIVALLPLEQDDLPTENLHGGFSEGAQVQFEANRYERDRRNRAAALAIHGCACQVCSSDLGDRYGPTAIGLIEVHHLIPVSKLGPDYRINPATDLVPLCPNCHRVAHRRDPPFTVDELKKMLFTR